MEEMPAAEVNVAVTVLLAFIVTLQVVVPVHPPDHPAKVALVAAAAVSVTTDPVGYVDVQVDPQLMPEGLLVTVPEPVPALCTVS
jgi:L-cysteine desulfidase